MFFFFIKYKYIDLLKTKKSLFYVQNKIDNAIPIKHKDTYGLFRSPIRAHFQNIPRNLLDFKIKF